MARHPAVWPGRAGQATPRSRPQPQAEAPLLIHDSFAPSPPAAAATLSRPVLLICVRREIAPALIRQPPSPMPTESAGFGGNAVLPSARMQGKNAVPVPRWVGPRPHILLIPARATRGPAPASPAHLIGDPARAAQSWPGACLGMTTPRRCGILFCRLVAQARRVDFQLPRGP